MQLSMIKDLLNAEVLCNEDMLCMETFSAFASDLMSDVLALSCKETILITGLTNIQTIRTAEMLDIKCIIFVRNKKPDNNVIQFAKEKGICLLATSYTMFTTCGILYCNGIKGADMC
ncbi:DRTGG domain-containing protein [Caloramator fervidus]|uniref:DRTGG domain-containing protein n=2 Tax=Caloramator fervidus TaxID=29344 RepID=A0A1H5S2V1_9CLOT|nr:DRTGG domain-containing protein [Caloramator fervidus]SEF44963.1 DRTGG domain-containing protein [Caloramator fervidus]